MIFQNQSDEYKHTWADNYGQNEAEIMILKGATYYLSSPTIIISLLVISHNSLIIHDYWPNKAKFVPGLFMGIALSDILNAQAQLVISLFSILVYNKVCSEEVLYRSLYYYMVTGLPGYSCARLFNVALSLTLTVHLRDPFHHLNHTRLKTVTLVLAATLTLIHLADMLSAVLVLVPAYKEINKKPYALSMLIFHIPGFISLDALGCLNNSTKKSPKFCHNASFYPLILIDYIWPPLVVFVCMISQVRLLRRSDDALESSVGLDHGPNGSPAFNLRSASRHASHTIILTSVLFFVCHTALFFILIIVAAEYKLRHEETNEVPWLAQGVMLGVTNFTLLLIYAACYPVILISRKPQLRERYINLFRRIVSRAQ